MTLFQLLQSRTPSKTRLIHAIFMIVLGMAAGFAAPHAYAQAPKIAIAIRVMREAGIGVEGLLSEPRRLQRPGDVQFTKAGSTRIAELQGPRIVQAITEKRIRWVASPRRRSI